MTRPKPNEILRSLCACCLLDDRAKEVTVPSETRCDWCC